MHLMPIRISFVLFILAISCLYPAAAATELRTALVIGNSAYSSGPLKNPVNDASNMAEALQRSGFKVTLKKNANLQEMVEAIEDFGNNLKRGGVGLFYFAGHGVQVNNINYLMPVNTRINKESDVRFHAVDAGQVLAEMEYAHNGLNIVILDACRDNPFGRSFRSASRGLAIMANAPTGTFISYSTGAGQVARDGEGRNSPYTKALLDNIIKPGLTINKVFMNVRRQVMKKTGQVPWELSSLVGDFFFIPGKEASVMATAPAITAFPEAASHKETGQDGRFIAYSDGTVLDKRTKLMWAAKDNGIHITRRDAKIYCENYRAGGYKDWRMPTHDELAGLYDEKKFRLAPCRHYDMSIYVATELIDISCLQVWTSDAYRFDFNDGSGASLSGSGAPIHRALPVRSSK